LKFSPAALGDVGIGDRNAQRGRGGHVKTRKLSAWLAENGVANPLPQSPVTSDQPEETISLIPNAAAKLRITAFPR
jgi:hypothetical protein